MTQIPEPFASIPRQVLTFGPSPLQHLPRMSKDLSDYKVQIWAKREDLNSGLAYGGNKTRKLEYLIPEALQQGCDTLVSVGGVQSNHTRQVAAVAANCGLKARLLQEHWVPTEEHGWQAYDSVGNIQLSRIMGADTRISDQTFEFRSQDTLSRLAEDVKASGGKPYQIPAGASDHPLGGLGFARWIFELHAQEQEIRVHFTTIIVCAVTGSTFAGMIAGQKLFERTYPLAPSRKIIGIDASATPDITRAQVLKIARMTAEKIGLGADAIDENDVILDERYHAGRYGIPDKQTWDAIEYCGRMEAFIVDPVYEGKSAAAMIDMIKKGEIAEGETVLYAHLGGQPALNAYTTAGHQ